MTAEQRRRLYLASPSSSISGQEENGPLARIAMLAWQVLPASESEREVGARLFLLDAREGDAPALWQGRRATEDEERRDACLALVGRGQGEADRIAALLGAGVTHLLHWPASDEDLSLALEAAFALAGRAGGGEAEGEEIDPLTDLVSREGARQGLARMLRGEGERIACLLIGISQFDSINAAYGKAVGDQLLAQVARRISQCVKKDAAPEAMVARMGGTEYLVAMSGHNGMEEEARDLARLILTDVARPYVADDNVIRLTARCGIAECAPGDDGDRLLRRANAALADARRSGASDIWFRAGGRGNGAGKGDPDRLDADLRLALDRDEIAIVYQPQYDSYQDRVIGVEALARWNHPQLGQLDAGTLFAAADRSDYLLPLSLHIQQRALTEAGQWPATLDQLRLSINVTAIDLAQEDFLPALLAMVEKSGFPPERLTVEITESGLIENIDRAALLLKGLRQRGIRVAIDDFGTGYSSLAYLKALYPDYLKIDYSLSRDILGTSRDRIILRAIIAMARSLALTVIAEGVESEEQLTLLAREGCDIYQGFLRSAALSSADLVSLLSKD